MLAHACMRARAPPLAAATGAGPGSGSGSLPGLVFFESGMGCEHTRSATRTRPAPLSAPPRQRTRSASVVTVGCVSWIANSCDYGVESLQRFRPNRCNLSLGSDPLAPPGAL